MRLCHQCCRRLLAAGKLTCVQAWEATREASRKTILYCTVCGAALLGGHDPHTHLERYSLPTTKLTAMPIASSTALSSSASTGSISWFIPP